MPSPNSLRILIVGSGGREHALAWRCRVEGHDVWVAPGSAGIATDATCVAIPTDDHIRLVTYAVGKAIDLAIIGPEQPLVAGLADRLRAAGIATLGPSAAASRIEGSKADAKAFMARHRIPTAAAVIVSSVDEGLRALQRFTTPPVIKASGLAAGKGVTVAESFAEAEMALRSCLESHTFGEAGATVVLEERLQGEEASFFVLTDGERARTFLPAQDHKRLEDGDRGPNTGGMGAYCPVARVDPAVHERVMATIVEPTLAGLRGEGTPFVGLLFVGLMIDDGEPRVIEYNCRFGDPEAQPLLFGAEDPLVPHFLAAAEGRLTSGILRGRPAATVVLAAAGYPTGRSEPAVIDGLERLAGEPDLKVFHAGTRQRGDGEWETAGGRVLGICARGDDLRQALARAYAACATVSFAGMHFRRDIGARAR